LEAHFPSVFVVCRLATISTFTEGYHDEVVGEYKKAYPDAPFINGLFYFVSGIQYDCTLEKDQTKLSAVRHEFIDAYKTIRPIQ
jgi:hypothetical protein